MERLVLVLAGYPWDDYHSGIVEMRVRNTCSKYLWHGQNVEVKSSTKHNARTSHCGKSMVGFGLLFRKVCIKLIIWYSITLALARRQGAWKMVIMKSSIQA